MKGALPPVFAPNGAHPVGPRAADAAGAERGGDTGATDPEWRSEVLAAAGCSSGAAQWRALPGGRVNRVWRVDTGTSALTVKLYRLSAGCEFFPNRPEAEWAALAAGAAAGRVPEPIAQTETRAGPVLVYRYLAAERPARPGDAGRALRALHRSDAWEGLDTDITARWPLPPGALTRLARRGLTRGAAASVRRAVRAAAGRVGRMAPCPLHGDPVPANIVVTPRGPMLIDWQCPGLGDPASDLALYLSPGMQMRYGTRPLTRPQRRAFRAAYGDARVLAQYDRVAQALHARIAAHCAETGDHAALAAEIAWLNAWAAARAGPVR